MCELLCKLDEDTLKTGFEYPFMGLYLMARRTSPLTISVPFLRLLLELLIVFFCFVTLIVRPFIYKKLVAFVVIAIFPYGIEHYISGSIHFIFLFQFICVSNSVCDVKGIFGLAP